MFYRKGFTLVEIMVILVIIGILAAIAVPNYTTYIQQGAARAAQNNLVTIYNAEKNYYFTNASFYKSPPGPCNDLAGINPTLSLNITDTNFNYCCKNPPPFTCEADSVSIPGLKLTIDGSTSIVLPGASGTLNPSCTPAGSIYCPS